MILMNSQQANSSHDKQRSNRGGAYRALTYWL
jgi:hypothetical protein